jgi:hypothetical protein
MIFAQAGQDHDSPTHTFHMAGIIGLFVEMESCFLLQAWAT